MLTTLDEITDEERQKYDNPSTEDREFFAAVTAGLPIGHVPGLGPHSVRIVREVLEFTKAKTVLELGFGVGGSAALWLGYGRLVTSVDALFDPPRQGAVEILARRWPGRFDFLHADTKGATPGIRPSAYDLVFIDGAHDYATVKSDISLALRMRAPWVLFDDWFPCYGPGVQLAVKEAFAAGELKAERQWGNVVLCSAVRKAIPEPTPVLDAPIPVHAKSEPMPTESQRKKAKRA
jgi:hypothetical protein